MFNVPPIRDTQRNTRLKQLEGIAEIQPVAPYPRIEAIGHSGDETERPDAVDERLRSGQRARARRARTGDDDHQVDEYA
ncbi:hypothetical protein [Halorhodospira halophila]|uniref:Uncharacterized protein n=1 Tax=Halorhodospira halophila (strain DSM 244 / SL1) TaxID=349124 RepID=A1WVP5_HALHL|nr:hypothetical protein [Halorhodospira halophila]ABM61757.1 hypothetical protein Hhal_0981 [Halorhodospira halophila SL1]MBK1728914.1 hypothetical protein [Halorhodospira halophila]